MKFSVGQSIILETDCSVHKKECKLKYVVTKVEKKLIHASECDDSVCIHCGYHYCSSQQFDLFDVIITLKDNRMNSIDYETSNLVKIFPVDK